MRPAGSRRSLLGLFVRPSVHERPTPVELEVTQHPEPEEPPEPEAPAAHEFDPRPPAHGAAAGVGTAHCPPVHSRQPLVFRVREHISPGWRLVFALVPFVVALAWWLWFTAGEPEARHISPTVLPSPAEVVSGVPKLLGPQQLLPNVLLSLIRVLGGFLLAGVLAVPLGIAMGSFSKIGSLFGLITTFLSYLPIAAIVPLTIAWWHTGEKQKVGFLAIGTFAYLLPLVVRQINAVDHQYLLSAYAQGASVWQVVRRVLIPIAMPDIFNGLRLCLGIGWTYIVLAEVVKEGEGVGGVGNLILVAQRMNQMETIYLTLVAIMIVGAFLDRTCVMLQRWFFPWVQRGDNGEAGAPPRRKRKSTAVRKPLRGGEVA